MTKIVLIEEMKKLILTLEKSNSSIAHVGISLQAMAFIKDYISAIDSSNLSQLHNDPFYSFFRQASTDLITQFPLRKNALLEALKAYVRYLSPRTASDD